MALEEDLAEEGSSSPAASTSRGPQAAPLDASEDPDCPMCLDTINDEACVGWCRHRFCFPCIDEWARRRAVCPMCQGPIQHIFRKLGPSEYEVHHIPYNNSRGRSRHRSAERRWWRSSGHRHSRYSSRDRRRGHAGAPERVRSRSPRRHHDGHRRPQHGRGYDSSRSRRRQRSRARDAARDEDRAPSPQRDVPASLGRSGHRQRSGRHSSRDRHAARSRSRRRSRGTGRQAQQRRRDRDELDLTPSSGRREHHQRAGRHSSRQRHAARSRSRRRSRGTGRRGQQRRRDRDELDLAPSSRRREHRRRGGRHSSREGRAARSRSRRRSRSPAGRGSW